MFKTAAVLAALFAGVPEVADAKCMRLEQRPTLRVKDASVPMDGALVVADETLGADDKAPMLAPAEWKLSVRGKLLAPVFEPLAPGLSLVRLPPKAGTAKVMQGKKVVGSLTLTQQVPAKLAAPEVTSLVFTSRPGRLAFETLKIELASPVPAGTLAVVIADKAGKGRSFELVREGEKTIFGFHRGRCESHPEGTVLSVPGDEVVVFYVDRFGRRSAATAPMKVTGTIGISDSGL